MRDLPRLVQPFLTWLSGVPLDGKTKKVKWRPVLAAVAGMVQTAVGVGLGLIGLGLHSVLGIVLLVASWPIIGGGTRRLDVVVVHQTLHRMFARSTRGNLVVSEIVTTLLWRPPYAENREEHLLHHAFPCSNRDGDTIYLRSTGARPGMSRQQFRRYLLRAVFSPMHHYRFFSSRLRANFGSQTATYRRLMSFGYAALLVAGLAVTGWWLPWLLVWVIPVSVFFQTQTLLYTLSEHRWWLFDNAERLTRAERDQLTFGRFCGTAYPDRSARSLPAHLVAVTGWWLRMICVYAPYRTLVLVGDTVQHDLHHVRPTCDWANSPYVRSADVAAGSDRYYEVWGGLLNHVYAGNSVVGTGAERSVARVPAAVG